MSLSSIAAAPRGKTYEIWVIEKDGKPKPAGLFSHGGTVTVTRDVHPGATVAVTLERAGGVKSPTGKILIQARVPA